jgi:hypothetical protein
LEPWPVAKSFGPTADGSTSNDLDSNLEPHAEPGSTFVTFRPRKSVAEDPVRISTQISCLYDELEEVEISQKHFFSPSLTSCQNKLECL